VKHRPRGQKGRWFDLGLEIHQWVLDQGLPHYCRGGEIGPPPSPGG
jgi:hypothetical protein